MNCLVKEFRAIKCPFLIGIGRVLKIYVIWGSNNILTEARLHHHESSNLDIHWASLVSLVIRGP